MIFNFVAVVSDPCESQSVYLKQEECDVHVSDDTGKNSVDNTAQSNLNIYIHKLQTNTSKCNICCKSFASKQSVTSRLYQRNAEKSFKCNISNK